MGDMSPSSSWNPKRNERATEPLTERFLDSSAWWRPTLAEAAPSPTTVFAAESSRRRRDARMPEYLR